MSTTEILAQLPNLTAEERSQVFQRLCELQEADLLRGVGPTDEDKRLLDEALAKYGHDRQPGRPWREVIAQLRQPDPR